MGISNGELVNISKKLGYKNVGEGLCAGATAISGTAVLLGVEAIQQYNDRLDSIDVIHVKSTKRVFEKQEIEIKAFFDALVLHTEPYTNRSYLPHDIQLQEPQDIHATLNLFGATQIAEQGGVHVLLDLPKLHVDKESFFKLMEALFHIVSDMAQQSLSESVRFFIDIRHLTYFSSTTTGHSMMLGYAEGKWYFYNTNGIRAPNSLNSRFGIFNSNRDTSDRIYKILQTGTNECYFSSQQEGMVEDIDFSRPIRLHLFSSANWAENAKKISGKFLDAILELKENAIKSSELRLSNENFKAAYLLCESKIGTSPDIIMILSGYEVILKTESHNPSTTEKISFIAFALFTSIGLKNTELFHYFLEQHNGNINERQNNDCTLLLFAAQRGTPEMMQSLLSKGADLTLVDKKGLNPLMLAVKEGTLDNVKFLVDKFDLNVVSNEGYTALMYAVQNNDSKMVCVFLQRGIHVKVKNTSGQTVMTIAVQQGYTELVKQLAPFFTQELLALIDLALLSGQIDTAKELLLLFWEEIITQLADRAHTSFTRKTIETAVKFRGELKETLSECYDLLPDDERNIQILYALFSAKSSSMLRGRVSSTDVGDFISEDIDAVLMAMGVNEERSLLLDMRKALETLHEIAFFPKKSGHMPSFPSLKHPIIVEFIFKCTEEAIVKNDIVRLRSLLKLSRNYNIMIHEEEHTVSRLYLLLIALKNKKPLLIIAILEEDAQWKQEHSGIPTILAYASENPNYYPLLREIEDLCKDNDAYKKALKQQFFYQFSYSIGWGTMAFFLGNSHLICAVQNNDLENTQKLVLRKDEDVNHRNCNGYTALMVAAENGNLEIARFLLTQKANVNAQTHATIVKNHFVKELEESQLRSKKPAHTIGMSALMLAAKKGHLDMVKLLLKHNANANLSNTSGKTALMFAVKYGHLDIVKFLIENGADTDLKNKAGHTAKDIALQHKRDDIIACFPAQVKTKAPVFSKETNSLFRGMFASSSSGPAVKTEQKKGISKAMTR